MTLFAGVPPFDRLGHSFVKMFGGNLVSSFLHKVEVVAVQTFDWVAHEHYELCARQDVTYDVSCHWFILRPRDSLIEELTCAVFTNQKWMKERFLGNTSIAEDADSLTATSCF